jgi:hypothetical protein
MYIERGEPWFKTEKRAYLIVDAGIICPVRDVESFRCELQVSSLA